MFVTTPTQAPEKGASVSGEPTVASLDDAPRRLFTVDEYHRMFEAGILGDDERVELLEGVIVVLPSQNPPHASAIQRLNKWLVRQLDDSLALLPQLPVTLGSRSEPVPDLAVVRAEDIDRKTLPKTALLVIEVADTSLRKDRGFKAALYARFGIAEYWIVVVQESAVEVYRDPDPAAGRYRTLLTMAKEGTLVPARVPGVSISLADLFA
jgi:Uma2 family endonuclease